MSDEVNLNYLAWMILVRSLKTCDREYRRRSATKDPIRNSELSLPVRYCTIPVVIDIFLESRGQSKNKLKNLKFQRVKY